MSVIRRVSWLSQQRADSSDVKSVESAVSNDFDELIESFVTGTSQGYVLRGFEISMAAAIGGASNGLQLIVDPGAVFHGAASQSGTFYLVPSGTSAQALNSATNTIVDGAFTPNAINYIGIDYERFLDTTTNATVYLWDPVSNTETTKVAPRAQILRYRIKITSNPWASNVLPIATVTTNADNTVASVADSRNMLFRLATGGASPNPFYVYPWTAQSEGRTENAGSSSTNGYSPFHGGDKMLGSFKDWMNALMSSVLEIKGTPHWYSPTTPGSLTKIREDLANTVVTANSNISHGILPNSFPALTTTGNTTFNSNQLTNLGSTSGLSNGQVILGAGIPPNTFVNSISGAIVTMSNAATATAVGVAVSFVSPSVITQPGQINWASNPSGNGQIYLKLVGSRLSYKIVENPSSASVTLADNQVAYLNLVRDVAITPNLLYTVNPSTTTVASVGSVAWTSLLQAGDYIRVASDTDAKYFKIQSIDSLSQVTLTGQYNVTGQTASGLASVYAFGNYTLPGATSSFRDIQIANREDVPFSQDIVWLFVRSDDAGSTPRVYVKFLGQEITQGQSESLSGLALDQMLQYMGSPLSTATIPGYVSAFNAYSSLSSSVLPQITQITVGASPSAVTTILSNQYFLINSSGNNRRYYVWFNKDGTGTDPLATSFNAAIEVDIATGDTNAQVATKLAAAMSDELPYKDFTANAVSNVITITNNSAGVTNPASNYDVSSTFAISTPQSGTGTGNVSINDSDNLTIAIKKLDRAIGILNSELDEPSYDESSDIVSPVTAPYPLSLPNNSRLSGAVQRYTVGKGILQVFLNGQYLRLGVDWAEIGTAGSASNQIQILQNLVASDTVTYRMSGIGSGAGGGGGLGPAGPAGPAGPPGADAAGGPIAISTKTSNYTVFLSDNVLLADCTGGSVTFTLPTAASSTGRLFYFKKIDSSVNAMVLQGNGSETIDGFNTQTSITQYEAFTLITNGSTWYIL